jgi:hypothetical protein
MSTLVMPVFVQMRYNARMNFQPLFSPLLLLVAALLFSLWVGCAQNGCAQDVLDAGNTELTLDADIQVDDTDGVAAITSSPARTLHAPRTASYPKGQAQVVLFNCFSPPDRPPLLAV